MTSRFILKLDRYAELEEAVDVMMARAKRIYVLIIKVNKLGRVVQKPVNVNPGLNVNSSITFSYLQIFFTSNVSCSVRLLQLKTEQQLIQTDYLNEKLQN